MGRIDRFEVLTAITGMWQLPASRMYLLPPSYTIGMGTANSPELFVTIEHTTRSRVPENMNIKNSFVLFNDVFSISDNVELYTMIVIELERIWEEAVVV
jgi:hypothetical protein